jgi:hypothetical protein
VFSEEANRYGLLRIDRHSGGRVAHLLRLIVLVLVFMPGIAWANIYPSEAEARSACESARQASQTAADNFGHGTTWGCVETTYTTNGPVGPVDYPAVCNKVVAPSPSTCQETFAWEPQPMVDCESLNYDDPATPENEGPGEQLFLSTADPTRCVAANGTGAGEGCALVPADMSPIETITGSVQGQPATFNRYQMTYSGDTCTPGETAELEDFEKKPDGKECNPELGVCVTPDGKTEYCTFNADGSPSKCVPATDYDNDGIDDKDDTDPTDPEDMKDDGEGDESDNNAAGGATCEAPPTCKGDGIACATLLQQWRTRCAIEGKGQKLENTACDSVAPLKCTGLTLQQCYSLGLQKKQTCDGPANGVDWDGADTSTGTELAAGQAWADGNGGEPGPSLPGLDDDGFLGGARSCPTIPSVSVFGTSISFNIDPFCGFLAIGAQLVLLFAALASARVIGTAI